MSYSMNPSGQGEQLSDDLIELIGEESFIKFVEAFGGIRLYVARTPDAEHEISKAIGLADARLLAQRYSPCVLRIPLARKLRARHYRAIGLSNAQIARKLGMTESGIDRLFAQMKNPPVKGSAQLSLEI